MKIKNTAAALNLKKLYKNEMGADVHFALPSKVFDGGMTVPAHKAILAAASPVFENLFYSEGKEGSVVHIIDISYEAFVEFLQFFYVTEVELTEGNIFEVFNLINKYDLSECKAVCENFLTETVTTDLVCLYYDLAMKFQYSQETIGKMEEFIAMDTELILKSNTFKHSSETVLKHTLQMDALNCSETNVFDAAISWAIKKCKRKDLTPSAKNLKNELGDSFSLIRFPTMSEEELYNCSEKYIDLFEMNDFDDIVQYVMNSRPLTCAERFSTTPRHIPHIDAKFWEEMDPIKPRGVANLNTSEISFRITHGNSVLLVSYDVIQPTRLNLPCYLKSNNCIFGDSSAYSSETIFDDFKICQINLKQPILCEVNKEYTLVFEMHHFIEEITVLRELKAVNLGDNKFWFHNKNFFLTKLRFEPIRKIKSDNGNVNT